jgi:hypothetical protein
MMTMTKSTNVPFGRVGKGDSNCNSNGDGISDRVRAMTTTT